MADGKGNALKELFPEEHIPTILTFILKAGSTLRKKTDSDREDWLSHRLCNTIKMFQEYRDSAIRIQYKAYPDSTDLDLDIPLVEFDLQVQPRESEGSYFVIEAKRLRVRYPSRFESGSNDYVEEGMMRFVTGKYAPQMESSAMLGYVFDGDIVEARAGIDKSVKSKADELKLNPPKRLKPSRILPGKSIDETCHDLANRTFTIYHIFLPV